MIRIGTRGSKLAIIQAEQVKSLLLAKHSNMTERDIDIIQLVTEGDIRVDVPLADIGGKGLFVKNIEQKLIDGDIDIAVHCMKDLPTLQHEQRDELFIAAILKGDNKKDAMISKNNLCTSINELPTKAKVGTSSPRRQGFLKRARPDLDIINIRGSVLTRIARLDQDLDAVILATASLTRLQYDTSSYHIIDTNIMLPSAGQGSLGIQCLRNNHQMIELVAKLDHEDTHLVTIAEREVLSVFQGDCHTAIAAYATIDEQSLTVEGIFINDNGQSFSSHQTGHKDKARYLGAQVGNDILQSILNTNGQ